MNVHVVKRVKKMHMYSCIIENEEIYCRKQETLPYSAEILLQKCRNIHVCAYIAENAETFFPYILVYTCTFFWGSSIPKWVHVCSTNASYSLNDPGSSRRATRSLAVSRPCGDEMRIKTSVAVCMHT